MDETPTVLDQVQFAVTVRNSAIHVSSCLKGTASVPFDGFRFLGSQVAYALDNPGTPFFAHTYLTAFRVIPGSRAKAEIWYAGRKDLLKAIVSSVSDDITWVGTPTSVSIAEMVCALIDSGIDDFTSESSPAAMSILVANRCDIPSDTYRNNVQSYIGSWDTPVRDAHQIRKALYPDKYLQILDDYMHPSINDESTSLERSA